jgi:hypothetical protein
MLDDCPAVAKDNGAGDPNHDAARRLACIIDRRMVRDGFARASQPTIAKQNPLTAGNVRHARLA